MKTIAFAILFLISGASAPAGQRTSARYSITADTTDAAGSRATSASYTNAGSAGFIAGVSSIATPAETAKSGYIAQLFDVSALVLNSAAPDVNEGGTLQLAAWQLLDDATFLTTDPAAVTWGIVIGPIAGISSSGLATAGLVFRNTSASVSGNFGGFTGSLSFTVLDSIPDNFGSYAGDGIGDDWQVQYFGQNNPLAAPALDPDGDGQTNLFEFTAGLSPNDPQSRFTLRIEPVPGFPARKNIVFSPRLDGRTYIVEHRAVLNGGAWTPLTGVMSDNGGVRTVTDANAANGPMFYRVRITAP